MAQIELTREELEHNLKVLRMQRDQLEAEIGRLQGRVRVEQNAKNQAYSFILQSGLYSQWVEFCKFGLHGDNPHQVCTEYLDWAAKNGRLIK